MTPREPDAPLGPVRHVQQWYQHHPDVYNHGGWDISDEYWLDQMGHEYTSIEHLGRCAVARALGVER